MKKVYRKKYKKDNRGSISQYILTFAFCYSALVCFSEASKYWYDKNYFLSIVIFFAGFLSFIAIFRWQIASFIRFIKEKLNAKRN